MEETEEYNFVEVVGLIQLCRVQPKLYIISDQLFDDSFNTHTGEKSTHCSQQDFSSSNAGDLNGHLKTHTGEKPNNTSETDEGAILGLRC